MTPYSRMMYGKYRPGTVSGRAVALWTARSYDPKFDRLYDLSGNGLHARLGSAVGADTNDPLRLQYRGQKTVYLPGSTDNYLSSPDSAALDITGDIDLRAEIAPDTWSPGTVRTLVAKYNATANQRSYRFIFHTVSGQLRLQTSTDGTAATLVQHTSSVGTGFSAFSRAWVRVTLDVDNGAGGNTATFYTSTDGVNWTQLGTTSTIASTTSIFSGGAVAEVGSTTSGTVDGLIGSIYRAQIYNGINGTKVFDFNAEELVEPYASITDVHGNVITLNRSSTGRKLAVVDRDMFLLGTDDYFEVADHPLLNFGARQDFTVCILTRSYAAPAGYLISKFDGTPNPYWAVIPNATLGVRTLAYDGAGIDIATADNAWSYGTMFLAGMRRTNGRAVAFANNVVSTSATLNNSTSNALAMRIGARVGGAYGEFEFIAAAIFREALSADELTRLRSELLT